MGLSILLIAFSICILVFVVVFKFLFSFLDPFLIFLSLIDSCVFVIFLTKYICILNERLTKEHMSFISKTLMGWF